MTWCNSESGFIDVIFWQLGKNRFPFDSLLLMAHLFAGRAYDASGKRDEALAQYKEVLARPNVYDAHDEAKKGLKQAYKPEQLSAQN